MAHAMSVPVLQHGMETRLASNAKVSKINLLTQIIQRRLIFIFLEINSILRKYSILIHIFKNYFISYNQYCFLNKFIFRISSHLFVSYVSCGGGGFIFIITCRDPRTKINLTDRIWINKISKMSDQFEPFNPLTRQSVDP